MTRKSGLDGLGSIPGKDKKSFLYSTVSNWTLGPTQPLIQWVHEGVEQPRREADHSPPSRVKVKNGGDIPYVFMVWCLIG
jgi:hypothetical protein